jgi:hypothetical protein
MSIILFSVTRDQIVNAIFRMEHNTKTFLLWKAIQKSEKIAFNFAKTFMSGNFIDDDDILQYIFWQKNNIVTLTPEIHIDILVHLLPIINPIKGDHA